MRSKLPRWVLDQAKHQRDLEWYEARHRAWWRYLLLLVIAYAINQGISGLDILSLLWSLP